MKNFESLSSFHFKLTMTYETLTIPLETEKLNTQRLSVQPVEKCTDTIEELFGHYYSTSMKPDQKIIFNYKTHPVYQGFLDAYRNHRPITISPDIIWLLIVQGFSYHVCANSEELREEFVNFKGQKKLTVKRKDLNFFEATPEDWMSLFPSFISQITEFTGKSVIDTLTPNFTTTTPVSLAAGQMSIMSAFKHYFKYKVVMFGCGLPYVTIEGSVEDWEEIINKMENLKKYGLGFWIDNLHPIISKIIDAKKGSVDKEFWLKMIKVKDSYGFYDPGFVDGWFTNFFLYDENGHVIDGAILDNTKVASEMLTVPFELKLLNRKDQDESEVQGIECEFLAGFVGMTQNEETGSLKPEIGWIIREKPGNKKDDFWGFVPNGWEE